MTQFFSEVCEFGRATRESLKGPGGEILEAASQETNVKRPFIQRITEERDAQIFALMTCFGATVVLVLIFIPWELPTLASTERQTTIEFVTHWFEF